ncbi:hypothetical protein SAMN04489761_3732 [Tenacibaculum sp. MAR_2009_124]|uniref:hypothetical protein n=1 Tax=Tenacibaculum sp. MAR_2009_124 TaxID=1250059 RepID=UPI000898F670|nr:hypothetical protein [Tenacibaculum sp. MAR_2009_124]SEC83882.1 hypothetical protein SAMN04489761_3732 [Tenacibaculum sp. MAR_2009_124]
MFQKLLFAKIQEGLQSKSLNEEIAKVLDISYDAAHRRTSMKSKISLDEAVLLANYFDLSLDSLTGEAYSGYVSMEKTSEINNEMNLEEYFRNSYEALASIVNNIGFQILYSAKDIPLFHLLRSEELCRFKIYVWLKLLDKNFRNKSFNEFYPKLSTIQSANKLADIYNHVSVSEIWDVTTVNSTLKQIHFYYKASQINYEEAIKLCDSLKELIDEISTRVVSKKQEFNVYYNELLLMNNNVLVFNENQQMLFVPNTMLSYFKISDKETCMEAKKYFDKQIMHSKLLNASGEKEQNQFYNKVMKKIEALAQLIKAENVLDFE